MGLEKPRNVIGLTTESGVKLNAIWKSSKNKWFIIESDIDGKLNRVIKVLTPSQFQDAVDNAEYSFDY